MTGQNRSAAVMQQRAAQPARLRDDVPDALDYYPTPPWATRALCEFLSPIMAARTHWSNLSAFSAWDPACGEMHMVRPLQEYFGDVAASDIYRYQPHQAIHDFLDQSAPRFAWADFIVTNPPFMAGRQFVELARRRARHGVAVLARTSFGESEDRYYTLFAPDQAPTFVVTFCERVVMLHGRLVRANELDPFNLDANGQPRKASTATSSTWYIWLGGDHDTRHRWIPPGTRLRLERPGDYPDYSHLFPDTKGPLL